MKLLTFGVVDNQKEYRPLQEWPIKPFDSFLDKCSFIFQVFQREEIARSNEKKGHVELEYEMAKPAWRLSMGYNHQDDSNAFTD